MRVLQLGKYYYPYMGGIENHLYLLCSELKRAVDLDVVVCNSERTSSVDVVDGVRVTRCFELANVASTSLCPSMPLELSRRQYDLLHLHFPHPMGVMSYLFGLRAHRHALVVTYHSDIVKQERLLRAYLPFMRRVLERANAIVCTSPNYLEGSEVLAPYRDKCRVIPYGIDLAQFERTPAVERQAAAIRARFGGRPLVLAVGRLVYYKGFEYVVRAMREVEAAELLLVGTGPLKHALEQTARECGVASRVHFVGEVNNSDLAPYYFASDVYALPSVARSEAFGIVQLEAMACGLPVVNTQIPRSGVPFVSRNGESGITVPPMDAAAFAQALKTVLGDRELARSFGEAGRARVKREFSREVMGERMRALYDEVTRPRTRRASEKGDLAPRASPVD
jgi:glycosyltransferase involved in cell wall biosynthesis